MKKEIRKMIITIDGSSWTGKSTAAKALAQLLGYQYLNTGAMFRAIGYLVKQKGLVEEKDIVSVLKDVNMEFKLVQGESHLFLNGEDVTKIMTSNESVSSASKVADIPAVREKLLQLQRTIASKGGFVVEGRDTGTTVFPDADWKFFLDASMEVRVKRFFRMLPPDQKAMPDPEQVRRTIQQIDERDRTRTTSPLAKAKDAIWYDNSESPTPEQDAMVMWYYITKKEEMIHNLNNPHLLAKLQNKLND